MKKKSGITCTGCGIDSVDTGDYNRSNKVQTDGTFADNKFVCTRCYMPLILRGLDLGPPKLIQKRAMIFCNAHPNE